MSPRRLPLRVHVARVGAGDVPLPAYQTLGAVGMDLCAAIDAPLTLAPGDRALVGTGWAIAVPEGFEGQVRPRSGLALKHGITVLNSPGTIDPDFRGELRVLLINHGREPFVIARGDRIAQLVIAPTTRAELVEITTLPATARGGGGYGSTGIQAPKPPASKP
ncbi:MAG: dUTP diphosphatase [Byssovorax sp.]